MRVNEVLRLTPEDVNDQELTIQSSKKCSCGQRQDYETGFGANIEPTDA
jgi:hypothetical protein